MFDRLGKRKQVPAPRSEPNHCFQSRHSFLSIRWSTFALLALARPTYQAQRGWREKQRSGFNIGISLYSVKGHATPEDGQIPSPGVHLLPWVKQPQYESDVLRKKCPPVPQRRSGTRGWCLLEAPG